MLLYPIALRDSDTLRRPPFQPRARIPADHPRISAPQPVIQRCSYTPAVRYRRLFVLDVS